MTVVEFFKEYPFPQELIAKWLRDSSPIVIKQYRIRQRPSIQYDQHHLFDYAAMHTWVACLNAHAEVPSSGNLPCGRVLTLSLHPSRTSISDWEGAIRGVQIVRDAPFGAVAAFTGSLLPKMALPAARAFEKFFSKIPEATRVSVQMESDAWSNYIDYTTVYAYRADGCPLGTTDALGDLRNRARLVRTFVRVGRDVETVRVDVYRNMRVDVFADVITRKVTHDKTWDYIPITCPRNI